MLKISVYLPKGTKKSKLYLEKEKFAAKKLSDKAVVTALTKIIDYIDDDVIETTQGYAFFADAEDFAVIPYDGDCQLYNVGNTIVTGPFVYLFNPLINLQISIDVKQNIIGLLKEGQLEVLWDKEKYLKKDTMVAHNVVALELVEQRKQLLNAAVAKLQDMLDLPRETVVPIKKPIFKRLYIKREDMK